MIFVKFGFAHINLQCIFGAKPRYPSISHCPCPPLSVRVSLGSTASLSLQITNTNACCPTGLSHCLSNYEETVVPLTCLSLCLFTNTYPSLSSFYYIIGMKKFDKNSVDIFPVLGDFSEKIRRNEF